MDLSPHRPALLGAAVALIAGVFGGAVLKADAPTSLGYGQQLILPAGSPRAPNAFDAWYPVEGPPPAWMEVADLETAPLDDLDRSLARLRAEHAIETALAALPPRPELEGTPLERRLPPADPPSWGWDTQTGPAAAG